MTNEKGDIVIAAFSPRAARAWLLISLLLQLEVLR